MNTSGRATGITQPITDLESTACEADIGFQVVDHRCCTAGFHVQCQRLPLGCPSGNILFEPQATSILVRVGPEREDFVSGQLPRRIRAHPDSLDFRSQRFDAQIQLCRGQLSPINGGTDLQLIEAQPGWTELPFKSTAAEFYRALIQGWKGSHSGTDRRVESQTKKASIFSDIHLHAP